MYRAPSSPQELSEGGVYRVSDKIAQGNQQQWKQCNLLKELFSEKVKC